MTSKIKTTDLLDLLTYAGELDLSIFVKQDKDGDYVVKFYELFTNNFEERVVINKEGISCGMGGGEGGNQSFNDMVSILNGMLKQKEEEKLKSQKRQELLNKLTDEEKKLLGVK
jgi:hypothetical protein